jgi:ParB family transcriptional regulator, chromosome partitioning protein
MVTKKPKGLGLGLEALLGPRVKEPGDASTAGNGSMPHTLKLAQLRPGKYQPRTRMDEGSLYELAESIRAQGVMQPILVRPVGAEHYEIIAGERRMRAAKLAGLDEVPVLVRDVPDESAAAMALIENIQRENLNPLEEARALERLISEFGLTHQLAAEAVGRSRAAVSNLLRLLELPDEVCERLAKRELEMGHARALLGLPQRRAQIEVATLVVGKSLSVRETEALVRHMSRPPRASADARPNAVDPNIRRLQDDLSEKLGAAVAIEHALTGKGRLVVKYNSLDELDGILGHIV